MANRVDDLMDQYDRGVLTRRQLVTGLLVLALGREAGAQQTRAAGGALAPVLSFNHVHVGVSDHEKSVQFYSAMFGCKIRDKGVGSTHPASQHLVTMNLPGSKADLATWFSLDNSKKPGMVDHIGLSIDLSDPAAATRLADDINKRFPAAKARAGGYADPKGASPRRMMVSLTDPDGLRIGLHERRDDGWLPMTQPKESA